VASRREVVETQRAAEEERAASERSVRESGEKVQRLESDVARLEADVVRLTAEVVRLHSERAERTKVHSVLEGRYATAQVARLNETGELTRRCEQAEDEARRAQLAATQRERELSDALEAARLEHREELAAAQRDLDWATDALHLAQIELDAARLLSDQAPSQHEGRSAERSIAARTAIRTTDANISSRDKYNARVDEDTEEIVEEGKAVPAPAPPTSLPSQTGAKVVQRANGASAATSNREPSGFGRESSAAAEVTEESCNAMGELDSAKLRRVALAESRPRNLPPKSPRAQISQRRTDKVERVESFEDANIAPSPLPRANRGGLRPRCSNIFRLDSESAKPSRSTASRMDEQGMPQPLRH
jgi:hypothetical protein